MLDWIVKLGRDELSLVFTYIGFRLVEEWGRTQATSASAPSLNRGSLDPSGYGLVQSQCRWGLQTSKL